MDVQRVHLRVCVLRDTERVARRCDGTAANDDAHRHLVVGVYDGDGIGVELRSSASDEISIRCRRSWRVSNNLAKFFAMVSQARSWQCSWRFIHGHALRGCARAATGCCDHGSRRLEDVILYFRHSRRHLERVLVEVVPR